MENISNKKNTLNDKIISGFEDQYAQASNPLNSSANIHNSALGDYNQTTFRPKYDKDISDIVEIVRILNNMAPIRMPEYNFNMDEINGERYYKPDGDLLLIREYDSDVVRDYYPSKDTNSVYSIDRILEHDKNTGRLRSKIEPIKRAGSRLKTNIAIFDQKINNKYTIIQLTAGGIVSNFSEFSGKGKSFQTLFRNINTFKPARYIEGKEDKFNSFSMVDCLFNDAGEIVKIKRYNNKREITIDYTETTKNISVRTK